MSYPQAIQEILVALNSDDNDWTDVWYLYADINLTHLLCYSDTADFIVRDGNDAYLFVCNEQTGKWTVQHVGRPIYEVEPKMINKTVDFHNFLNELKYQLPGVQVKCGSALSNHRSEFVNQFKPQLERAVQNALENL